MPAQIVLSTVGTSLFYPNLSGLKAGLDRLAPEIRPIGEVLADAYEQKDPLRMASELARLSPAERLCGAEINSLNSLFAHGYAPANAGLFFLHSDTPEGRSIAAVLVEYHRLRGHSPVVAIPIVDLQDQDPKRFRTKGLRNLAKEFCRLVRDYSSAACAINATGGYKAQIAVAVLIGQALGAPVYYMHERFSEIISFPPMPVAFDYECWMNATAFLNPLENHDLLPFAEFEDSWDERYESLIDREKIDDIMYVSLSATGQIFHETFRERFRSSRDQILPPPASAGAKKDPVLHDHGVINRHRDAISLHLRRIIEENSQVTGCVTNYCNPNLPLANRFLLRKGEIEGIWSNGSETVKFLVTTTSTTSGQMAAVVAMLNEWLQQNKLGR